MTVNSLRGFTCYVIIHLTGYLNFFDQIQVVKQCCATDGVEPQYIKEEILPEFFKQFWTHRMALDRRNYKQVSFLGNSGRMSKIH